jgi:hypothetical protein
MHRTGHWLGMDVHVRRALNHAAAKRGEGGSARVDVVDAMGARDRSVRVHEGLLGVDDDEQGPCSG